MRPSFELPEGVRVYSYTPGAYPPEGLLGGSALAHRYGMTAPTMANWEERHADFPAPAAWLATRSGRSFRPLWDVAAMDKWVLDYRSALIAKLPTVPETKKEAKP